MESSLSASVVPAIRPLIPFGYSSSFSAAASNDKANPPTRQILFESPAYCREGVFIEHIFTQVEYLALSPHPYPSFAELDLPVYRLQIQGPCHEITVPVHRLHAGIDVFPRLFFVKGKRACLLSQSWSSDDAGHRFTRQTGGHSCAEYWRQKIQESDRKVESAAGVRAILPFIPAGSSSAVSSSSSSRKGKERASSPASSMSSYRSSSSSDNM